jgi:hypothetical protein
MHLSFVLLPSPSPLDSAAILTAHSRIFAGVPTPLAPPSTPELVELRWPDEIWSTVALMPAPIPNGEAESAARFSLAAFSRSGGAIAPHGAHLVIATLTKDNTLETLTRHTRVVAACASACNAIAVYEGNASATHPAAFYVDIASTTELPLMLWTGVSIAGEPDGRTSILTLGAEKVVGVPDMMIAAKKGSGNEALAFLFDMLAYVARRGEALAEGHTVGRTAEERLPVRYVPSPVTDGTKVARIELPS